jgi:hypothetical protein
MMKQMVQLLRREEGGIATYVANAVMVLAVLGVAVAILAATSNLGKFMGDRIFQFISSAP